MCNHVTGKYGQLLSLKTWEENDIFEPYARHFSQARCLKGMK